MPLIHVNVPQGSLDETRKNQLIEKLTKEVLKVEGAPETPEALSISWLFLNEVKDGGWGIGGNTEGVAESSPYLVYVTVPKGSLDDDRKQRMAEAVHKVLLEVSGEPESPQSRWCIIREVPDGNWASGGQIYRLKDIAQFAGIDPNSARYKELLAANA